MRIVRFVGEDGRVHHGEDHGDGSATLLADPHGIFGPERLNGQRDLLRGKRAVVADDDTNMRDLMATTLTKVGCQCIVCSDGRCSEGDSPLHLSQGTVPLCGAAGGAAAGRVPLHRGSFHTMSAEAGSPSPG